MQDCHVAQPLATTEEGKILPIYLCLFDIRKKRHDTRRWYFKGD